MPQLIPPPPSGRACSRRRPAREASPAGTRSAPLFHLAARAAFGLCLCALASGAFAARARAQAPLPPPVLVSESGSTRAVALDSVLHTSQPFSPTTSLPWSDDGRTRVILFAMNLGLGGENPAAVSVDAEDGARRRYVLRVEQVSPVAGHEWLSAVVVRLGEDLGEVGDVLVRLTHRGGVSNRVRVGIGHVGGGPPDDPGAGPTPAPAYVVLGRLRDAWTGVGVAGATLSVTGGDHTETFAVDSEGRYALGLLSPGTYTLAASAGGREFHPAARAVTLDGPARTVGGLDFISSNIFLRGRVTDGAGRGVFGVKVALTGARADSSFTDADGSYAFALQAPGDFTVTPSLEQDFYTFAPASRRLSGLPGAKVGDFTASLNASASPSHVLEFDGTPKTVDYSVPRGNDFNVFWPEGVPLGRFFWEFWAMPGLGAEATYMLSDGYGGGHALLFGFAGFNTNSPGRFRLFGNIWDGGRVNSFTSDEGPGPNEWGHFAVGWDGRWIVTYFNGVPVGRTAFRGPRFTPGGLQGGGRLLIGGSDHSNFVGRIAQVRGFEGRNPRAEGAASPFSSFAPQTVFDVDGQLLSYYFRPSDAIADLSRGFNGRPHTGLRRGTGRGVLFDCPECPPPQFVVDPTAPDFSRPSAPGQTSGPVDSRPAAPSDALVFDSFSRRNSTHALGATGGLGTTEAGALGQLIWETGFAPGSRQPFGVLNGRAVLLSDARALAWVRGGGARGGNFGLRVERRPGGAGTGHSTGLAFRVADGNNFFFAYTTEAPDSAGAQLLNVGYFDRGRRTDLTAGLRMPAGWTVLTVVTTGAGTVRVFADSALVYETVDVFLSGADGLGIYNDGPGMALSNRWDNFTVFEVTP